VTNHPPVANAGSYSRGAVSTWHISAAELLANATDLIDGDPLTLVGVDPSTNGITLFNNGTILAYTNPNLVNDQFTYTVADGFGGTNSGIITLTAGAVTGTSSITAIVNGNPTTLTAYGITGATYVTQRATNLDQVVWDNIATNQLEASGPFTVTDSNPPSPAGYYRIMYPVPQP
jgi:hypothetical protein